MGWQTLGSVNPAELRQARLQCHVAATLLARLGRGYLDSKPDDSHTNLGWDSRRGLLTGRPIAAGNRTFSLALELSKLRLAVLDADGIEEDGIELDGITLEEASSWLAVFLRKAGLPSEPLFEPLHFDLPEHPVAAGKKFGNVDESFAELARYYSNLAPILEEVAAAEASASEPRCWPHHFDLATLIELGLEGGEERSLGIGLSPGDESYNQPYIYVNRWPYPDAESLTGFDGPGHWHTEGWIGAVLTATELIAVDEEMSQESLVRGFLVSHRADAA